MKRTTTLSKLDLTITYSLKDNSPRGCHTVHGSELKLGDKIVIDNYFTEIIEEPTETVEETKISISKGNAKMGAIPSVSLPPVITCPKNCPCAKKCYAAKLCRIYPSVKKAYQNNLDILSTDWSEYWKQTRQAIAMTKYFRFHVSGDIPNKGYFKEMVISAKQNPSTHILAFTKQYDIVNNYINIMGELPENLHIIFSEWGTQQPENPHNLPTAAVIFKGTEPKDNWKICGGNCAECACQGIGCWELKQGETIAFYEH